MLSPGSNTATVRRSWRLRALSMLLAQVRGAAGAATVNLLVQAGLVVLDLYDQVDIGFSGELECF